MPKGMKKNVGRYVFGGCGVIESDLQVAVHPADVAVVENPKAIGVDLRPLDEEPFVLIHGRRLDLWRAGVITKFNDSQGGEPG